MPSFFTGKGDDGSTGLLGEGRVAKYDLRLETLGCIDEATAQIGLARVYCYVPASQQVLLQVQRHLYHIMGEIAATPENAARFRFLKPEHVTFLEEKIEEYSKQVEIPREFIVAGDTQVGAHLDVARTVVRRAERRVVELSAKGENVNSELLRYFNRLSSLLFLMEIYENQSGGTIRPTLAKGDA
jgi:cob(I)alamin adenosyltransferase